MTISLEEALRMEMDFSIPDDQLPNRSSRMRRRMRNGEAFTTDSFEEADRSLFSVTLATMKRLGYEVKDESYVEDEKQRKRYWVLNGYHFPTEEQLAANRAYSTETQRRSNEKRKARDAEAAAAVENLCELCDPPTPHASKDALRKHADRVHPKSERLPAKPKTNGVVVPQVTIGAMPPGVPGLGAGLQVFLLHLDDEGSINVGFRDGNGGQFMAQMVGTVAS